MQKIARASVEGARPLRFFNPLAGFGRSERGVGGVDGRPIWQSASGPPPIVVISLASPRSGLRDEPRTVVVRYDVDLLRQVFPRLRNRRASAAIICAGVSAKTA